MIRQLAEDVLAGLVENWPWVLAGALVWVGLGAVIAVVIGPGVGARDKR